MTHYEHRQFGTLVCILLGAFFIFLTVLYIVAPETRVIVSVVLGVLVLCLILFATLTVTVTDDRVRLHFGPGVIWRQFFLNEIVGVRTVKNPWYYGWGIRLTPHGWLYNVSGFDAIELELSNKRKVRIGTDQPQELEAAIRKLL